MAGNTFGTIFRVTTFGESHGAGIGCVVDGCPAGIFLDVKGIQTDLDRRKPGQSSITTQRKESDTVEILSGVSEDGKTLGTPIALLVRNSDARSSDYHKFKDLYRPGHADFTYDAKYGVRDYRGGGRSSGRETLARVAAGAIARQILRERFGTKVVAFTQQVGDISAADFDESQIGKNEVRSPDAKAAKKMIELIESVRSGEDSIGGVVKCIIRSVPVGIGEPVFDRLDAELAHAMLSIPGTKGFEIGSGFTAAEMRGSEHNDEFFMKGKKISTRTNHAGGVLGGISTGQDIVFRVAFKPTATISQKQKTVSAAGKEILFSAQGRHDPCIVPRAVPVVEAMAALTILDLCLRNESSKFL